MSCITVINCNAVTNNVSDFVVSTTYPFRGPFEASRETDRAGAGFLGGEVLVFCPMHNFHNGKRASGGCPKTTICCVTLIPCRCGVLVSTPHFKGFVPVLRTDSPRLRRGSPEAKALHLAAFKQPLKSVVVGHAH